MSEVSLSLRGKRRTLLSSPIDTARSWSFAFTLGLLALGSCGGDSSSTETEAPETTTAPTTTATAPAKAAPLQVNVFLELSGGMKGFMPVNTTATEPTAFQKRISLLASRTNSNPAVEQAQFWLSLNKTPQTSTYAHFRDIVQGDTKEAALGTELPTMLENILAQPNATQKVNVVVSDFIYGPQRQADVAVMGVRITDALAAATKKQLAVAVLAETSAFYGTFHPAVKTPKERIPLKGEIRPYYIWVIGPAAAVGRYLNEVAPAADPKTQQAYFGLSFPKVPYAAILTQVPATSPLAPASEGSGSISYAGAGVSTNLEVSDVKAGVDFTVALDLKQLPAAWREPAFLARNLQADLPGGAVKLVPNSVKAVSGTPSLAAYTHTVRVHLTSLPKEPATLTLRLPAPGVPAWVAQWSTENDNRTGPLNQTYRLTEIMTGLRDAFPQQLPTVFTATFSLSQD